MAGFTYIGVPYKSGVNVHLIGFINDPKNMSDDAIEQLIRQYPKLEGMLWKRNILRRAQKDNESDSSTSRSE